MAQDDGDDLLRLVILAVLLKARRPVDAEEPSGDDRRAAEPRARALNLTTRLEPATAPRRRWDRATVGPLTALLVCLALVLSHCLLHGPRVYGALGTGA